MDQTSGESLCGGVVVGTIFGTTIVIVLLAIGLWIIYKKYWKRKTESSPLVVEDPENIKVDYAFDNPAFKGDKSVSPFDNRWKTPNKRETVDDSVANASIPRLVPLRGSDFTGLGIEVCGSLREGIFVKKVMPQGPAANIIHRGDKITSVTIDFRQIAKEDAVVILSAASPYNVQLELIEPNGAISTSPAQNPSQSSLTHPLFRSRSQEDLNTIVHNARKKLFSNDDNSTSTPEMDQPENENQQKLRLPVQLPQTHEEHEKKNSLKKIQSYFIDMVEEKFQTKATNSRASDLDEDKKGMKFGIRVFPPSMISKDSGKSPNKSQADNDNNSNIEKIIVEPLPTPPEAMKRSKNKNMEAKKPVINDEPIPFERQASINSSGIKRDAAGIPQEMPTELMQAALTALNNRKINSICRKSKGKAPNPPNDEIDAYDNVDHVSLCVSTLDGGLSTVTLDDTTNNLNVNQGDFDSDAEMNGKHAQQIELNSKHVTVHQASEEDPNEERRTASLGDLSKLGMNASVNLDRNGTLERAQSLEISDPNYQIATEKPIAKRRESQLNDSDQTEGIEIKDSRFNEPIIENLETLQTVRLKSSYEWGNLEDAIYDGKEKNDAVTFDLDSPHKKLSTSSMDMMSEVLAAADKFDREITDIKLTDVMDEISFVANESKEHTQWDGKQINKIKCLSNNSEKNCEVFGDGRHVINMSETEKISTDLPIVKHDIPDGNVMHIKLSPVLRLEISDIDDTSASDDAEMEKIDSDKNLAYDTTNSDAKASKYSLNKIERPKSEVLKQLIAQQSSDKENSEEVIDLVRATSNRKPLNEKEMISLSTEMGPISLTIANQTESESSESSQISPIFSSDGKGVNNISISSNDSNSMNDSTKINTVASLLLKTVDNKVTISTDNSKLSSIIIDDENINFQMQTLDDEEEDEEEEEDDEDEEPKDSSPTPSNKNEVFIVESLSSKKSNEFLLPVSNGNANTKSPTRGFVTEIRFPNLNKDKQMNAKNLSKSLENRNESSVDVTKMNPTSTATNNNNNNNIKNGGKPVIVEEEYIPRNSEIRFTTSTYQSPRQFEKRNTQIDQIRSNFERSHTSEIPVPIRKISTASTPSTPSPPSSQHSSNVARVSPSKIPVFHSQKSSDNLHRNNGSASRVSVSVTSIKNSSRNPSGK